MTSTVGVQVTGLRRLHLPPRQNGDRIVASFDVELAGIRLTACSLLRLSAGDYTVLPPRVGRSSTSTARVSFTDRGLRGSLKDRALEVYRALGGSDVGDAT
jgi:hypothetical protein